MPKRSGRDSKRPSKVPAADEDPSADAPPTIIPDFDPQQFATDAIPMSELQNIAESVSAKHTLFVMDACYSGLGLTRGGGNGNFLRVAEVAWSS